MKALHSGRRGVLRLGLGLAAGGLGGAALAQNGAGFRDDGAGARLVLPLSPAARWQLSASDRPAQLRLALPGGWNGPSRLPGAGPARGARWDARSRTLLIDLAGPVAAPTAGRDGGNLVLTLRPGPARGFARLARGQVLASGGDSTPAAAARLPLIVLDPGHGGKDPGTIGVTGTREKHVVLAAALELKRRLEATGRVRVAMTRTRDVFIPLAGRVAFARRQNASLFVSLHADSAPGARGASVYTLSETASDALSAGLARRENAADAAGGIDIPPVSPEIARILVSLVRQETRQGSDRMASMVVRHLRGDVPLLPNTHRQAAFAVLKAPDIPSVLVEMGFLSNRQDEAALKRPDHRARVALALAGAANSFLAEA
ncbi:N-acetylmuramoyl-L-alanine amidase family protein [Roseomonas sp. BN140053]|uniref:N-acetylmuramoyl-L-alanine amidase family protein n=1 Tax=Roseomonas sp. BN140053 TaxID=3391898 RepID=UPI0039E7D406